MKMGFRWYGKDDPVSLRYIAQIPNMHSVVSAVYDVPPGGVWSRESIGAIAEDAKAAGLVFDVVESVPVHEDIKLGLPARDAHIEAYCENLRRLGAAGVKCVCYNFMPVFDWTRTQLDKPAQDGSTSLVYYADQLAQMDPLDGELSLPGWDASYQHEDLQRLFALYNERNAEDIWANLEYFLKAVIPVAAENGIFMAIHPDDPPWPIFGLPRIITGEAALDRFLALVDDVHNGLTLCTGSLGCDAQNDMVHLADKYAAKGRIHFVHARNVQVLPGGSFEERAHYSRCGSLDMVGILRALHRHGYAGYIRPDHGRMIWGETGRPGYGLYDRALGATYLNGIWETLDKLEG